MISRSRNLVGKNVAGLAAFLVTGDTALYQAFGITVIQTFAVSFAAGCFQAGNKIDMHQERTAESCRGYEKNDSQTDK
jgi:hypothetical protein